MGVPQPDDQRPERLSPPPHWGTSRHHQANMKAIKFLFRLFFSGFVDSECDSEKYAQEEGRGERRRRREEEEMSVGG